MWRARTSYANPPVVGVSKQASYSLKAFGALQPGYEVRAWFGMFAPARLPAGLLAKLNAEARRAMHAPEIVKRMTFEGAEVVTNSPQDFAAEVRAEYAKWRELVKKTGIKL